jgi:type II secretory pathway pseudopilin PulG
MKKIFALLVMITILSAAALPAFAQGRSRRANRASQAQTSRSYYDNSTAYDNSSAYYDYSDPYRRRNVWDKHRDKLTLAIGTGAGAAIGGLVGGRRGAVIGALSGLGGSALYTYKLRKNRIRY